MRIIVLINMGRCRLIPDPSEPKVGCLVYQSPNLNGTRQIESTHEAARLAQLHTMFDSTLSCSVLPSPSLLEILILPE